MLWEVRDKKELGIRGFQKRRTSMSYVIGNYYINKQWAVDEAVLYSRNLFWTFEVQDFLFNIWNSFNRNK